MLYQLVVGKSDLSVPFGLFTSHPRSFVQLDTKVIDLEGTLVAEENDELVDPLLNLEDKV